MTIPPPLTLTYWFSPSPPPFMLLVDRLLLAIFAACLVAGVVAHIVKQRGRFDKLARRVLGRAGTLLICLALTGLLLYAFLYQRVPYLSMRFWYLVAAAGYGYWAWRIAWYAFVTLPKIRHEKAEREKYEKWLPKPKK